MNAKWSIGRLSTASPRRTDGVTSFLCLDGGLDAAYLTLDGGARTRPERHRKRACIAFVVEGRVEAVLDGRAQPLKMNDFVRIGPGVRHAFAAPEGPATLVVVHARI